MIVVRTTTMEVYAHEFARREHGEVARVALEASYVAMREASGIDEPRQRLGALPGF